MELLGDKQPRLGEYIFNFAETMVKLDQELGDCDLCVEFAHFLSNFITLERKKKQTNKNKNPVRCHFRFCDLFVQLKALSIIINWEFGKIRATDKI